MAVSKGMQSSIQLRFGADLIIHHTARFNQQMKEFLYLMFAGGERLYQAGFGFRGRPAAGSNSY